jgi:hypothetical protein
VLYQIWGGVVRVETKKSDYNRKRRLIELETLDDVERTLRLVTVK